MPAAQLPVARVAVDLPLAHLDRPFDYLIDTDQDATAVPGARVRVRFAGRLVDGFLLERAEVSSHTGKLGYLDRVVSAEPVLAPEIATLARAVADRYAGPMADVLRLAVPPRHARVEKSPTSTAQRVTPVGPADSIRSTDPDPDPDPVAEPAVAARATSAEPAGPAHAASTAKYPGPADGADQTNRTHPAETASVPKGWRRYVAGAAFLTAVAGPRTPAPHAAHHPGATDGPATPGGSGPPPRAVWQALPGENWPARLAEAAAVAHRAGRGALLLVPDATDLTRLGEALTAALPEGCHTTLAADLGPPERYRRFLAIRRGVVTVVAGTRAAAFAPVRNLGLLAMFDDGDDSYAEPRAPYPHAREVLMLRSVQQRVPLLIGGFARTAEAALLLRSGWARPIAADRATVRLASPRIEAAGDRYATGADSPAARARLSPAAFDVARRALAADAPVLVQVPRQGYLPGLACARCQRPSRCKRCHGPLAVHGRQRAASCRWCGVVDAHIVCAACASDQVRTTTIGARRTAEELGRAFPGVLVLSSDADARPEVPDAARLVVCTPGAEPLAPSGYGAALLLDGALLLGRADLRAAEEALRRWMAAAALVRPAESGGRIVVGADTSLPAVQALIRWDPAWHADAELDARSELSFPPSVAMASIDGTERAVADAASELGQLHSADGPLLPPSAELLGPVALADLPGRLWASSDPTAARLLVRVPQADRRALTTALSALAAARSARKDTAPLRIRVDPSELF